MGDGVKVLARVVIGLAVLVAAGLFIMRYFEDRVTDDMVAQTSRVAVPAGWRQLSDIVRREQFLCASPNPCPSIARRWQADRPAPTADDLRAIAAPASLNLTIDHPCQRSASVYGTSSLCSGTGTLNGYAYTLTLISLDTTSNAELALDVRPISH